MSLIDMVNEMEDKLFLISKNIERELNTVVIKGKINKNKTMKTILIKGKQGSGKTTLSKELAGKDSYSINDQSLDFRNVLSFRTTIIDDLYSDKGFDELLAKIKRIKKGKFIVCTQNEEFNEKGFDLVFRLY